MALSDIAAGIEVTAEQRDRGVATVDDTGDTLAAQLSDYEAELPCDPAAAAAVVEAYADGASVGSAGRSAGIAPMTAAKALHRLGVQGVSPLTPRQRDVVRDWIAAELPRADALTLTGGSETEFALAAYIETHDPIPAAADAVEGVLSDSGCGDDPLDETMSSVDDLL
ncbi:hypothetical protein [Halostella sp. PRR32]|uniref:DUF7858 family protein n=1 Tax=Halostella sp. PRR32 TaxID=3098147 RepID=UPI002B1DFCB4|nr:hypothetical protein [Halostella sp. PRR32]